MIKVKRKKNIRLSYTKSRVFHTYLWSSFSFFRASTNFTVQAAHSEMEEIWLTAVHTKAVKCDEGHK